MKRAGLVLAASTACLVGGTACFVGGFAAAWYLDKQVFGGLKGLGPK